MKKLLSPVALISDIDIFQFIQDTVFMEMEYTIY